MSYLKRKIEGKRYSCFPIIHNDLWDNFYVPAKRQIWDVEEAELAKDNYESLTINEKKYLKNILAFFTISDGLVIDNLATDFQNEVDLLEASYFYGVQAYIEQIHAETYSLIIDTYIKDIREKNDLFNAMQTNPAVKAKVKWAEDWIGKKSFAHRLLAFACVEGLSFSSVFAGVFWFRSRNKLKGLAGTNELIIRDETQHYQFANYLYKNYLLEEYKLSKEEIREIILSCYEVEKTFVEESMPDGLDGLTKDMMIQYVKFVTDTILVDFGVETEFNVTNPLDYMLRLGILAKNNFFEERVGQYTRVEIGNTKVTDLFDFDDEEDDDEF